jgi:hypothetical protein
MPSTLRASPVTAFVPRDIFILAGQSNMSGRGLLSEMPALPYSRWVKNFSNAWTWQGGAEPIDSATGQVDTVSIDLDAAVGPSMAFGSALAGLRPGREIGLVPCALGGSTMDEWAQNPSRSTLYGSMLARAIEASKAGTLKGAIFYQGENDTDTLDHVNTWVSRCAAMIASLRSDLGLPNLPFIVTEIGPSDGNPSFPYTSEMQAAQAGMTGSNLAVVSAADLTTKSDDLIHLTTASQMILGSRYATAMQTML